MKASDDLFYIIKSLSINEKRHFKLFSLLQRGEKKYLKIFNAIASQNQYDEKAILKKFSGEKFTINFSVAKAYLYDIILKSLELYNADSTDTLQIRRLISRAELLASKQLLNQAGKLLLKAKNIAEDNDDFTYQLEISQMQQKLMQKKPDLKWLKENKKSIINYENKVIEKCKIFQQYLALEIDFVLLGNYIRGNDNFKKIEKLKNFHLLKDESNAISTKSLVYHYHSNAVYYYFKKDFEKSINYSIKKKELIEQTGALKKKYFRDYLSAINNIIYAGANILSYEQLIKHLESMKEIKNIIPQREKEVMSRYFSNVLGVCIKHLRIAEGLGYANETTKWLLKQSGASEMGKIKVIYFNLASVHFYNAEYKIALRWLNKLFQMSEDIRNYLNPPSELITIIIHYELGNYNLVERYIKSNFHFFFKYKKIIKYESILISFIRDKARLANNSKKVIESFILFKKGLALIAKDKHVKEMLSHFDFNSWIDSKIENRSFAEVVKEKARVLDSRQAEA